MTPQQQYAYDHPIVNPADISPEHYWSVQPGHKGEHRCTFGLAINL